MVNQNHNFKILKFDWRLFAYPVHYKKYCFDFTIYFTEQVINLLNHHHQSSFNLV